MTWFILAPLSVAFTLLAILLAPVLALFVRENGYLPEWLWWFQTPDNPAIGDEMYRSTQMAGVTSRWWIATCWLARNPAYGFDHAVGAKIHRGFVYQSSGDEGTTNSPLHEGWVYRTVTNNDLSYYWQFYLVKRLTATRCLKLNLGWKLWGKLEPGQVRQLVVTCSPFAKRG